MKLVILLALVAVAIAAPVQEVPKIVRSDFEQNPEGGYRYVFETDDGTIRQEDGVLKEVLDEDNKPNQVLVVRGSYSYRNPEGGVESINYFADESGFHAEGDSIPKLPAARK